LWAQWIPHSQLSLALINATAHRHLFSASAAGSATAAAAARGHSIPPPQPVRVPAACVAERPVAHGFPAPVPWRGWEERETARAKEHEKELEARAKEQDARVKEHEAAKASSVSLYTRQRDIVPSAGATANTSATTNLNAISSATAGASVALNATAASSAAVTGNSSADVGSNSSFAYGNKSTVNPSHVNANGTVSNAKSFNAYSAMSSISYDLKIRNHNVTMRDNDNDRDSDLEITSVFTQKDSFTQGKENICRAYASAGFKVEQQQQQQHLGQY